MKPLVKDPNITLEQLLQELTDPNSLSAAGSTTETSHAHDVLNDISQKVMRILRKAVNKAEKKPELKQKLAELESLWGIEPSHLHKHLQQLGPKQAAEFVQSHSGLLKQLGEVSDLLGSDRLPIIYEGIDEFKSRSQTFGVNEKPADYLESFNRFINEQINLSVALSVIVNKPKDLTRAQLKEVRLLLDEHGYSEARLQSAWRNQTQQEMAVSIVGYIRQAALGEALLSFEQRVANAMQKIYALHPWTPIQRKWLDRLAKQLTHEVVIDQQVVNRAFAQDGGAKRLNSLLGGDLDKVLETLNDNLWLAIA